MKFLLPLSILLSLWILVPGLQPGHGPGGEDAAAISEPDAVRIYQECGLNGYLDENVFERALKGLVALPEKRKEILTIIDFTLPSTEKRMYVIDLARKALLYRTYVAHGKNTGVDEATRFSNQPQSLQSSPGFYLTGETYQGQHGYSLRLDGMEPGVNDRARDRAIVIHGADYVSEEFIRSHGRLGRSWGCPAVPEELSEDIIDLIKDGSCLYIHTDQDAYLEKSIIH